jgi:hypothetical protein
MINEHGGLETLRPRPIRVPAAGSLLRLTVELVGAGPRGRPMVSVAHYYEQAGDLVADPDMTFEVEADAATGRVSDDPAGWEPMAIQHSSGLYAVACWRDAAGRFQVAPAERDSQLAFARLWDRNLAAQGYLERFRASSRTR